MFVSLRRAQTWHFNKNLYKFRWHTSAYNARMKNSRDLILGEVVYIAVIYHLPDSRLSLLNGFDFQFWSHDWWKPRICPPFVCLKIRTRILGMLLNWPLRLVHYFGELGQLWAHFRFSTTCLILILTARENSLVNRLAARTITFNHLVSVSYDTSRKAFTNETLVETVAVLDHRLRCCTRWNNVTSPILYYG